ncbi:uncharacterized protein [Ptychodera flava]|uniref:uncharacterized protein n=1 Tax=Ptychodera flava TaxID=63121 RepID=UPI00396A24E9
MAEQQQVNAVEGSAESITEQGNFETIVANQTEKPAGDGDADIVSMAFADIDENTEYLQTVSNDSNLATAVPVDNVTMESTPATSETAVSADVSSNDGIDAVQQDVQIPQTVPSSEAVSVSTLGSGNVSPPVSLPASMLLGTIANLIDTSAGATSSTMTLSELQNNPTLMNILNSAEVQAAIQNHQHITIVQVPDRSFLGELNGDKNVTNTHVSVPPLAPISSTGMGTSTPTKLQTATVVTAVKNTATGTNVVSTQSKVTTAAGNTVTKLVKEKQNQSKAPKSEEKKKPHRSVTRSGRISKPPQYRVRDYKTLRTGSLNVNYETDDDYSDYTADEDEEEDGDRSDNFRYPFGSERSKKFKCEKCDKSYIGRAGLLRHYKLNPTHGNPDDVPEPPQPPKTSDSDKPPGRRPGRPPRVVNTATDTAKTTAMPALSKTVTPAQLMPKTSATTSTGSVPGVSLLTQTETPSDVKVVYPPQSLAKRKQRIRELLKTVGDEDVLELVLPKMSKLVTVWEFLLMKVERGRPSRPHFPDVYKELGKVLTEVRKMADECLEAAVKPEEEDSENSDDKSEQTIDIQNEAIAHVLGIPTGFYKVKDSPVPEYEFKYKLLVTDPSDAERTPKERRIIEVVSQDELVDQSPTKRRKLDQVQPPVQQLSQPTLKKPDPATTPTPSASEVNQRQQSTVVNTIQPRPQAVKTSRPNEPTNQPVRKMPPLASIASRVSAPRLIRPVTAPSISKPSVNSAIPQTATSSGTVTQRRILTLPPGFNITKTSDGYAIHKPDGTVIQITVTGDGGIPLETLQALINMDTSIFQTVQSSTPAAAVPNTIQSAVSQSVGQETRTVESTAASAPQASVAMGTDSQAGQVDMVTESHAGQIDMVTESQTEQVAMVTETQTEQINMAVESQTEQVAMVTETQEEQISMATESQTEQAGIVSDTQTEQINLASESQIEQVAMVAEAQPGQVDIGAENQIGQVDMVTDHHTGQVAQETVTIFTEEVSQTEVSEQQMNMKHEAVDAFQVESVVQEIVPSATSICTDNTTVVSEEQILTNGNSVSHANSVDNAMVNNVAR